jgi:hypothetical protein
MAWAVVATSCPLERRTSVWAERDCTVKPVAPAAYGQQSLRRLRESAAALPPQLHPRAAAPSRLPVPVQS